MRSVVAPSLVTRALINFTRDFTIKCYVPAIAVVDEQVSRKLRFEHLGFHILMVEFFFAYSSRTNRFKLKKTLTTVSYSYPTERYVRYSHSYEMSGIDKVSVT